MSDSERNMGRKARCGHVRIAGGGAIPAREGRPARIDGQDIAIFNLGDRFVAVDNRCPHLGGPLCDGIVAGRSVVCPLHGWKVNLETGGVERPRDTGHRVRTYGARAEAGEIVLDLREGEPAP